MNYINKNILINKYLKKKKKKKKKNKKKKKKRKNGSARRDFSTIRNDFL